MSRLQRFTEITEIMSVMAAHGKQESPAYKRFLKLLDREAEALSRSLAREHRALEREERHQRRTKKAE